MGEDFELDMEEMSHIMEPTKEGLASGGMAADDGRGTSEVSLPSAVGLDPPSGVLVMDANGHIVEGATKNEGDVPADEEGVDDIDSQVESLSEGTSEEGEASSG
ncbi:unnamed protein product [Calypogeia fissa]